MGSNKMPLGENYQDFLKWGKGEGGVIFRSLLIIIMLIRNGKIVWKHGPNRPFFLYNLSSENN